MGSKDGLAAMRKTGKRKGEGLRFSLAPFLLAEAESELVNTEPAWKTYLKIGLALTPTLALGLFYMIVNFPKAEMILKRAGFLSKDPGSSTVAFRFIVNLSYFVFSNLNILLLAAIGTLAALEWRVESWPRLRKPVCIVAAVLFNAFVLIGMTATSVTAFLALSTLQGAR